MRKMKPHTAEVLDKANDTPAVKKLRQELTLKLYPRTSEWALARSGITLAILKVNEKLSVILDKGKEPTRGDIDKILSERTITSKVGDSGKAKDLLKKYADALVREVSKLLPAIKSEPLKKGTLTELKCKNCGAPLPPTSKGGVLVCPYCGTSYRVASRQESYIMAKKFTAVSDLLDAVADLATKASTRLGESESSIDKEQVDFLKEIAERIHSATHQAKAMIYALTKKGKKPDMKGYKKRLGPIMQIRPKALGAVASFKIEARRNVFSKPK